jgi:hypothetical protein
MFVLVQVKKIDDVFINIYIAIGSFVFFQHTKITSWANFSRV